MARGEEPLNAMLLCLTTVVAVACWSASVQPHGMVDPYILLPMDRVRLELSRCVNNSTMEIYSGKTKYVMNNKDENSEYRKESVTNVFNKR